MRVDYATAFPDGFEAMLGLEKAVRRAGLEPALLELVKLRASQLNGCAYCLDMHSKDARARGEDEQRLHVLAAWREALSTVCASGQRSRGARRSRCCRRRAHPMMCSATSRPSSLSEEIAALTFQIVAINGWNRLAVGMRTPVGDYVSLVGRDAGAPA